MKPKENLSLPARIFEEWRRLTSYEILFFFLFLRILRLYTTLRVMTDLNFSIRTCPSLAFALYLSLSAGSRRCHCYNYDFWAPPPTKFFYNCQVQSLNMYIISFNLSSLSKSSNIAKPSEFRKRSCKDFRAPVSNIGWKQNRLRSNYVDICSHEVRAFVSSTTEQMGQG